MQNQRRRARPAKAFNLCGVIDLRKTSHGMVNATSKIREVNDGTQTVAQRDDHLRTGGDPGALLQRYQVPGRSLQPFTRQLRHPRQSEVVVSVSREDRLR